MLPDKTKRCSHVPVRNRYQSDETVPPQIQLDLQFAETQRRLPATNRYLQSLLDMVSSIWGPDAHDVLSIQNIHFPGPAESKVRIPQSAILIEITTPSLANCDKSPG